MEVDIYTLPFEAYRAALTKRLGYDPTRVKAKRRTRGDEIDAELRAQGFPGLPPPDLSIGISVTEAAKRQAERPEVKAKREEFFAAKVAERKAKAATEPKPAPALKVVPVVTGEAKPCRRCGKPAADCGYSAARIRIHDWICLECIGKRAATKRAA